MSGWFVEDYLPFDGNIEVRDVVQTKVDKPLQIVFPEG